MGVEANYFRGGDSSTWSTGSFSRVHAASTRNIYGFNTLDAPSTATISDVCTAGTACCTRGSVLLIILKVLALFGPSVLALLILPPRVVFRTPHTRVLQYTQHQQYPEYGTPQYCQHRQPQKKSIEHHIYEHVPCISIIHRHTYLQ